MRLVRRLRLRDEGGFTLIEMIMVVAILGTVLGGVTTVFVAGSRSELNVNNRFQAQEAARLAMTSIREDVHSACAASVNVAKTQVILSIPITDKTVSPAVPPDPKSQCGTVNVKNIAKIIYCVLTSPTVSTKFALYRSTASTCTSSSKLVADNLVNSLTGFTGFIQEKRLVTASPPLPAAGYLAAPPEPVSWIGSLYPSEVQTIDVDIPVSLKPATVGSPGLAFDLGETLALENTVWSTTTATSCSASVPCTVGPCGNISVAPPCFPPVIS